MGGKHRVLPLPVIRQRTRQTRVSWSPLLLGHHVRLLLFGLHVPPQSEVGSDWSSLVEPWVGLTGAEDRLENLGDGRGLCVHLEGARLLSCKSVGWAQSGLPVIGLLELVEVTGGCGELLVAPESRLLLKLLQDPCEDQKTVQVPRVEG